MVFVNEKYFKSFTHVRVTDCARCGEDHGDLHMLHFKNPPVLSEEAFTHYAICPNSGEPILMKIVADEDNPPKQIKPH